MPEYRRIYSDHAKRRVRRNPALRTITDEDFTDLVLAELPEAIRAAVAPLRPELVKISAKLLEVERARRRDVRIAEKAAGEAHKGRVREVLREEVEAFENVDDAKAAVEQMAQELAWLPPPGRKDHVGFSAATDRPMRQFLKMVQAGEDLPLATWLKAARLLIVHSKTQLPRPRVMGAVRFFEGQVPRAKPLGERPTEPTPADFDIQGVRTGTSSDAGKGTTSWERSGDAVWVQIPNKLRYKEAGNKLRGVEMRRRGDSWRLHAELWAVPALADWLEAKGAPLGARKLRAAFDVWAHQTPDKATPPEAPAAGADAPAPPDHVLASGKAGKADRRSGGVSDFDLVQWEWDGGDTVKLRTSMVKNHGRWWPVRKMLADAFEEKGRTLPEDFDRSVPGSRYDQLWTTIKVADVPLAAAVLRDWYSGKSEGPGKLEALAPHWAAAAGVTLTPADAVIEQVDEDPKALDPLKGNIRNVMEWAYNKNGRSIGLQFPFDSSRSSRDQVFGALREQGIPHRRVNLALFMQTPQIEQLIELFEREGRNPKAIAPLRELLPFWKDLERKHAKRPSPEEREKALGTLRLLRGTMGSREVERIAKDIETFAPYLVEVKPGDRAADLGPFGRWKVADGKKDKKGFVPGHLHLYMSGLGKLAPLQSSRDSWTTQNGKKEWFSSFDLKHAEEVARRLDTMAKADPRNKGLSALALSLRAALSIDNVEVDGCEAQEDLASAFKLSHLSDPKAKALIKEIQRAVLPELKPGIELREYQQIAAAFARANDYRLLVGDAPGLGKTFEAIGMLLSDRKNLLPALLVAPSKVVGVWPREAATFTKDLRVHAVMSGKKGVKGASTRKQVADALAKRDWDVLAMTWGTISKVLPELLKAIEAGHIKSVVYDEIHNTKNPRAAVSKAARQIAHAVPGARILMSGTPLENAVMDIWHPLHMMDPIKYRDSGMFKERFDSSGSSNVVYQTDPETGDLIKRKFVASDKGREVDPNLSPKDRRIAALENLRIALRCDMVRRKVSDVFSELPPKTRIYEPLALPSNARKAYEAAIERFPAWLCGTVRYKVAERVVEIINYWHGLGVDMNAEDALNRAVAQYSGYKPDREEDPTEEQIDAGLSAIPTTYLMVGYGAIRRMVGYAKAPAAAEEVVRAAQNEPKPIVVFFEHQAVGRLLRDAAKDAGLRVAYVDGSTTPARVSAIAADFQNGKYDIIFGSRAMTDGLTLTASDNVYFAEQWWNPQKFEQAEARILRADKRSRAKQGVFARHLYAPDTMDEDVLALLDSKREVIGEVLGFERIENEDDDREIEEGVLSSKTARAMMENLDEEGIRVQDCLPTAEDLLAFRDGKLKKPPTLDAAAVQAEEIRRAARKRNPSRTRRR